MSSSDSRLQIGCWLSSEEHSPRDLVCNARRAESMGFASAMISDHFHPWIRDQGQGSFVWAVIGGIAAATEQLRLGTGVTAPIIRMHPVVVAHAAATVTTMLEGRFFLGLGSGERLSEHVAGERWPGATERRAMLEEAVEIIRALLDGNNVNHTGTYYRVENAELFTRPVTPPPIMLAVREPAFGRSLRGRRWRGQAPPRPVARVLGAEHRRSGSDGAPHVAD